MTIIDPGLLPKLDNHVVHYPRPGLSNLSTGSGFELPLLLLLGFRTLIDELHARLAAVGHPDARPMHGFVCQAVGPDGASAAQVGRRLGSPSRPRAS